MNGKYRLVEGFILLCVEVFCGGWRGKWIVDRLWFILMEFFVKSNGKKSLRFIGKVEMYYNGVLKVRGLV